VALKLLPQYADLRALNEIRVALRVLTEDKKVSKIFGIPKCDMCFLNGDKETAVYEAKTIFCPWAYLCEKCFDEVGISLKMGLGRKLLK
jgi:hypothetical protein